MHYYIYRGFCHYTMLIDLSGQQFGSWTVIERGSNTPYGDVRWLCRCSCGTQKLVRASKLKDCSTCRKCYRQNLHGSKHHRWQGYEEIHGWYWSQVKKRAKKANIDFDLDISYAWDKFLEQAGCCALSGLKLQFGQNNGEQTASIDRVDSQLGYVPTNIQWVHKAINRMKSVLSQEEFIQFCHYVSNYQSELKERNDRREESNSTTG